MATEPRPLTLADLRLPGDVLGGAMLRGWSGPIEWQGVADGPWRRGVWGPVSPSSDVTPRLAVVGLHDSREPLIRLDFTRPETRDRAVRVIGADLLPIHAAEIRGDITPGEAAGLVWASVLRKAAGTRTDRGLLESWLCAPSDSLWTWRRRSATHSSSGPAAWVGVHGWDLNGISSGGKERDKAGRAAADSAALATGYALREPDGILLLPLPDGIGRLETRQ